MWKQNVILAALLALTLFGCGSPSSDSIDMETGTTAVSGRRTLGVNAYLWQASLDTLSFLRLATTDPYGGVIISDWYVPASAPDDRLKVTVYIMDRALRPDGLRVVVFRQTRNGADWQYARTTPETARKLEDAILTRARELNLAKAPRS
jgi:hypothetical protein